MTLSLQELPAIITDDRWHTYRDFRVLHDYDKYQVAEKAVRQVCKGKDIGSNVDTDVDQKRCRRKPRRFREDTSSEDSKSEAEDSPPEVYLPKNNRILLDTYVEDAPCSKRVGNKKILNDNEDEDVLEKLLQKRKHQINLEKRNKKLKQTNKPITLVSERSTQNAQKVQLEDENVRDNLFSTPPSHSVENSCDAMAPKLSVRGNTTQDRMGGICSFNPHSQNSANKDRGYVALNAKADCVISSPTERDGRSLFNECHSLEISSQDEGFCQGSLISKVDLEDSGSQTGNVTPTSQNAMVSSSAVKGIITGCKPKKAFSFGSSKTFEEAAPALECVLSAILKCQHDQMSRLDFIQFNVETLMAKTCPEEESAIRPEGMPPLKCKSLEDIEAVNNFLSDKDHRRSLMSVFSHKIRGIPDERAAARHLLNKIFATEGARVVSWQGTHGLKWKFEDSNICSVVEGAILKQNPNSNLTKAEGAMKSWFNTSFQRSVRDSASAV